MDDAFFVRNVERACDLPRDTDDLVRRHWTPRSLAFDQLHNEIIGADVVQMANIGMIERRHRARFALESFAELFFRELDRDVAIQACVACPVYLAHSTCANGHEDLVRAYSITCG